MQHFITSNPHENIKIGIHDPQKHISIDICQLAPKLWQYKIFKFRA